MEREVKSRVGNQKLIHVSSASARVLFRWNAKNLENALQFVIAEKSDVECAFALAITELHLGAETFAQLVLDVGNMDIANRRHGFTIEPRGGNVAGGMRLHLGDEFLGLPDVKTLLEDAFGGEFLLGGSGEAEDDLGVSDGEASIAQIDLNVGRELEQAQGIGDHGPALADFRGDIFLAELKGAHQFGVALCFFERIEVLALEILDECQFQHGAVVSFAEDDGDFLQAGELRGPPATFTGDQLEAVATLADDERLDDALFLDGIGQFLESDRGEFFARLERTGANPIQWNALHTLALVNERRGWNRRRRVEGVRGGRGHGFSRGRSAQQRAQPTTQSWFCHVERVK